MKKYLLSLILFTSLCSYAEEAAHPILLVPGLWYNYAPVVLGKSVFEDYVPWLVEAGVPREHIYVLDYRSYGSLKTIYKQLSTQITNILKRYPEGTQFDIMGHSLGGFVAFYTILEGGFSQRVRKFISLSGVPNGWNGYALCKTGLCGGVHTKIIPYQSPFVQSLEKKYADEIENLQKCSLYSKSDEFIQPYDAGRFEGGINVEIPNMRHMDIVWQKPFFDQMVSRCYNGSLQ